VGVILTRSTCSPLLREIFFGKEKPELAAHNTQLGCRAPRDLRDLLPVGAIHRHWFVPQDSSPTPYAPCHRGPGDATQQIGDGPGAVSSGRNGLIRKTPQPVEWMAPPLPRPRPWLKAPGRLPSERLRNPAVAGSGLQNQIAPAYAPCQQPRDS